MSRSRLWLEKNDPSSKPSAATKPPSRKQKQSLILLEEVDVLYEEDKQFWSTVTSLLALSKRPIIMTCTDESAVPLQMLSLHAILRFSPPPIDLATDYMLLVAASEGHILRREALKSLYESRLCDLRGSLADINFWCQFAVGSSKGGLDWFYPRWPPGKDIDEHGRTIRVVSEDTYQSGMGMLSQDLLESGVNGLDIEEEIMHEAWDVWHLDAGDWAETLDLSGWADKIQSSTNGREAARATLAAYEDFSEFMSVSDICSTGAFSSPNQAYMDTTLPELSLKVREDYILAHELIEATPLADVHGIGKDIALFIKSRSRKYLQNDQHTSQTSGVPAFSGRLTESCILDLVRGQTLSADCLITRGDFSLAFDPISEPEKTSLYNTGSLEASAFDRTCALIATDIAPFVRSIVSYDAQLQQDRARLSNLLSEGGRKGKRMRTTRSAMSALEGGARRTTRKERYFGPGLNPKLVLKTGMPTWHAAVNMEMGEINVATGSQRSSEGGFKHIAMDAQSEQDELDDDHLQSSSRTSPDL